MSTVAVEHARQQWEEGHRRLQSYCGRPCALSPAPRPGAVVVDELTAASARPSRWPSSPTRIERPTAGSTTSLGPAASLTIVQDAAFHLYSRGAVDYAP